MTMMRTPKNLLFSSTLLLSALYFFSFHQNVNCFSSSRPKKYSIGRFSQRTNPVETTIARAAAEPPNDVTTKYSSSSPSYSSSSSSKLEEIYQSKKHCKKTVVIAGATGYIGRSVVRESVRRGYHTVALVRSLDRVLHTDEGNRLYSEPFRNAQVIECDVTNEHAITTTLQTVNNVHTIISCLASPIGTKADSQAIDYEATLNCLNAGRNVKAQHFILLSAFCVRKPLLELQRAKLRFESELEQQTDLTWSIVRPTAFFKSVSGQFESIVRGAPYVLFGNGMVTRCNPISEEELAQFMLDCMKEPSYQNRIMNIGGPDEPLTNRMLGEMMFQSIGKPPKFVHVPTWIFDSIIQTLQLFATLTKSQTLEDAAETGRIGKYYAVEDMLTTDISEKYGKITMQEHYDQIAAQGQDPFTPIRATAIIAKFLEAMPAIFPISIPLGYALFHPQFVKDVVGPEFDFSLILASLPGHN